MKGWAGWGLTLKLFVMLLSGGFRFLSKTKSKPEEEKKKNSNRTQQSNVSQERKGTELVPGQILSLLTEQLAKAWRVFQTHSLGERLRHLPTCASLTR